jgi:DNA-binding NarL/FixJ family response regulator
MAPKSKPSSPARVVVADPHPIYRHGLSDSLGRRSDLKLVSEAGDAESAVEEIVRHLPDVAVVELTLLAEDDRLLERIAEAGPEVRVLLLCGRDDPDDIYRAIEAGAVGCLFKDAEAEEIAEAIATLARGEAVLAPRAADLIARQIQLRRRRHEAGLTERELAVLKLTAEGLSSERVASELALSQSTIKNGLGSDAARLAGLGPTAKAVHPRFAHIDRGNSEYRADAISRGVWKPDLQRKRTQRRNTLTQSFRCALSRVVVHR